MRKKTDTIRRLNDAFRAGRADLGQYLATPGINELGEGAVQNIAERVRQFDDFSRDNDPRGEHDFGSFDYEGQKIFWKIDYYNPALDGGSEDPADPAVTVRVLTVMLASEY